jgi:hypothetical protein
MSASMRAGLRCVALLAGVTAAAAAAQPNVKDGMWEVTTTVEMPGMPAGRPPMTMQHCITPKDAQDPAVMSRNMEKSGQCAMTDYKFQGNTATWKMACKGEGAMTGTGTATYSGNSYTMTNRMALVRGGQTMNMTTTQTGKYLGPCKK